MTQMTLDHIQADDAASLVLALVDLAREGNLNLAELETGDLCELQDALTAALAKRTGN